MYVSGIGPLKCLSVWARSGSRGQEVLQKITLCTLRGQEVFDRRLDGVERVVDVYPILKEGVLRDTPLHVAVRSQHFYVAKQLLARGANPSIHNAYDYSVIVLQ
eukprot:COSAG02_NODE_4450_length_5344_cov_34.750048_6_plen_104_part_00